MKHSESSEEQGFSPEDGSSMFPETLVSAYKFIRNYNPEDQYRHFYRRENLKSHLQSELWIVPFDFCVFRGKHHVRPAHSYYTLVQLSSSLEQRIVSPLHQSAKALCGTIFASYFHYL
jgi:hypothetical protein